MRRLTGHEHIVRSVAISLDGRWALSSSVDRTMRVWDLTIGQCMRVIRVRGCVASVALCQDHPWALCGESETALLHRGEGPLRLWDLGTGQCLQTFEGHAESIQAVAVSPDGQCVVSGGGDRTLRLWDVKTARCLQVLTGHTQIIREVAFSFDGHWILSAGSDNTVRLWQLDWEYEFPGWSDWDEGARPYLGGFLTLHCPYGPDGISRVGRPTWNEDDFQKLLKELQYRGYGWLRSEGVRREVERMAREWSGPPLRPWESAISGAANAERSASVGDTPRASPGERCGRKETAVGRAWCARCKRSFPKGMRFCCYCGGDLRQERRKNDAADGVASQGG